jgi:colanic acid/amylovoran biosynthesis protein
LTGINVFQNRGTEALAISIVEGLLALPDRPRLTVITRDMAGAEASLGRYGVQIVEDRAWAPPITASPTQKLKFRLKRWVRRDLLKRPQPQEAALAGADLVVVSGGDIFSSDYTIMERYLRQLDQPLDAGVSVLFFAQSIGPFKTEAERAGFRATARKSTVTVRESISVTYLTETLGLDADQVTMTADPAFLLAVPEETRADMMKSYGLTPGTYVAAACSRSISGFTGITHEGHVAAWVAAARQLMDLGEILVLVPHVQMPEAHQDDLALAHEIAAALGNDQRCIVLDKCLHSSVEFKAVLKGAQFVVAERTHGAIGAMSSGVPALSVGYSIKAEGVLRQLVKEEDLITRSLIGAPAFTAEAAPGLIRDAWDVREAVTAELAANLPAVQARSQQTFEIAAALLSGGQSGAKAKEGA